MQIATAIIFTQLLAKVDVPMGPMGKVRIFGLFGLLISIVVTWVYAAILTAADVWDETSVCRTDSKLSVIDDSPWFRFVPRLGCGHPVCRLDCPPRVSCGDVPAFILDT